MTNTQLEYFQFDKYNQCDFDKLEVLNLTSTFDVNLYIGTTWTGGPVPQFVVQYMNYGSGTWIVQYPN